MIKEHNDKNDEIICDKCGIVFKDIEMLCNSCVDDLYNEHKDSGSAEELFKDAKFHRG